MNKLAELPATIEVTYDAGAGTYMGKPSRIYSRTLRENNTNKTTGEVTLSVKMYRYWLSDSFRLVKMEQLYTHYTKARMIRQNFVTEFAFDPSIVINRPPIP